MTPYKIIPQAIPQDRRAEVNEKILFAIDTADNTITPEAVYNCYTGIGGLHGLCRDDYANYHDYAEAKKELEMGQFFTPHTVCRDMVELLAPESTEMILDMCCGMGNFFNWLPNRHNAYGFDVDGNAVNVARFLYPEANLQKCDIVQYRPEQRFDAVIGNPPFNLKFDGELSQFYYMTKAHEVLNPAGILMMIVPKTFLASEFWEKTKIAAIDRNFSFIGQAELAADAFASVGVDNFKTKVMVFLRESRHIEMNPYRDDEFLSWDKLRERIVKAQAVKSNVRIKLLREATSIDDEELERFEYRLAKYLYELKAHPRLRKHHDKAVALATKFRNQRPPVGCTNEEYKRWEQNKLTPAKVLGVIYRYIRNQYIVPRKEVALVKTNYGFKLKAYAPRLLDKIPNKYVAMYDLVSGLDTLPDIEVPTVKQLAQIKSARKLIRRKQQQYKRQSMKWSEMEPAPTFAHYLDKATFVNKDGDECRFTELQKSDINLTFQKDHYLLNWQQGSGKTAAVFTKARWLMETGKVKNVVILAPAIATNLTWETFLRMNRVNFITLRKLSDFDNIPEGCFIVVSNSMVGKFKRRLYRLMKMRSQKVALIFDESDEITNPNAERTMAVLDAFRRVKYKALATGTTTRNYIAELYSQMELLYNNSVNMMCLCDTAYSQDRETKEIEGGDNPYYGMPFPAHRGHILFKKCFCPGKASVFGIEKQNQDVYNKDHLFDIISKTIITRKFKEFAGEKYDVHTHSVEPHPGEREVFRIIMQEFCRICELYYNNTGDAKKEAALRMMRQIKLLIKACSVPNAIEGYFGDPYPGKVSYIADMLHGMPGKVAIGCTTLETLDMYKRHIEEEFPDRPLFVIRGDVTFRRRETIIRQFEATINGILICTQQSLKSSANIPTCNEVILESLQWNIPKMEQFYFRFIRLDSKERTNVHFVSYLDSIEQNLMALVLTKERLNEFIKSGEVREQSDIFDEFDISMSVIESLLIKTLDEKGNVRVSWGSQRIAA
ncbi:MAG: N-6 DNA methylase [Alistipes sp.]|jgi:predicted RNA methylase|nr:N-6 DNA methylase [Alistipes sp.]